MMNRAVELMIQFIDNQLEPSFLKMSKLNWDEQENMGKLRVY